jgi:hypothetical protein
VKSPATSSTAQIDSDAPHLSTKLPYELRSQAEKIDDKSVAANVKLPEVEPTRELSKGTQPQVVSGVAKLEAEMARTAKEFEERAVHQEVMYAQQSKMLEFTIAQMAKTSLGKKKPQPGQSGSCTEYEARATRRVSHEDARETRDGTNGSGPETTGTRESSGAGEECVIDRRDGEEHQLDPAVNCVKDLT